MTHYNDQFWDWVDAHRDIDPTRLRLNKKNAPDWIDDAIAQIENEKKCRNKFYSDSFNELVPKLMPITKSIEQASSARIAQLHYELSGLKPDTPSTVLDMTCGLGLDASFLARDPSTELIALDLDEKIASIATENFKNRPNISIIHGDSIKFLNETSKKFDLIFIDPARRDSSGKRLYNLHDCMPDVTQIIGLMQAKSSRIMIKMSPMLDITQTLRDLPMISQLYVIEERGECRELLGIIDNDNLTNQQIIVWSNGRTLAFSLEDENSAEASIAMPEPGQILLEPSPALMKAAPFKMLCARYNAHAIHPNTHLYITNNIPDNFPGKSYKIDKLLPFSSSNIKQTSRLKLHADVAVRNFPISADALRKRLDIKKSSDTRIIGITAADHKQYLLFLSPV